MYGYIYLTTNFVNGKQYIGQHRSNGFDSRYYGSGTLFVKALDKYGKENFGRQILVECESEEELNSEERRLIAEYDAVKSSNFYNIADGGSNANNLAGKTAEEIHEIVYRWREKMKNRSEEEREQTYKQWIESYNNHTPEEIEERRERHSVAAKVVWSNMSDEGKELKVNKAIETKKNWTPEQRLVASEHYTDANNRRWATITAEEVEKRTKKYKETRSLQTAERRAEISSNARKKTLEQFANMTEQEKEIINLKRKETWAAKPDEEKAAFSEYCSKRSRGRIWMHNHSSEILIKPEQLDEYVINGYIRGRKNRK